MTDEQTSEEVTHNTSNRNWFHRTRQKFRDTPDNFRLAGIGAWRGRERGLAVVAGVFLASLVITTVLSYGVGLSQIFFAESLDSEPFDAKIEFAREPVVGAGGYSNNTTVLESVCDELTQRSEIDDCTIVLGRQGIHGGGFFNEDFVVAQPLEMRSVEATNPYWSNVSFSYPELADGGPPISDMRAIRLLGPEAFDGQLAERLGERVITGMGEWPSPEVMEDQRGIIIPSNIVAEAKAEVGDVIDKLTFAYVVDEQVRGESGINLNELDEWDCPGDVDVGENGYAYCRMSMEIHNLTILGVYEPWDLGNPTLAPNPIFVSWTSIDAENRSILIDNDHMYLGIALDRTQLPTSSTADAEDWLEALSTEITDGTYADGQVNLFYFDIVSGTITFLNIFLGLIQTFDYIIMVPIVILSLSVLIYGLILSLEQRRREISIHRVIGADSSNLQGMVLLELAVMSFFAWLGGYLLALAAVPLVLSSVGFLAFETGEFSVDPRLGVGATIFTAVATLGLAVLFGRSRTRDFIELEIEEGVKKEVDVKKPKRWLHWLMFLIGMMAFTDTYLEMNGSEDGLVGNFFLDGLLNIFGPFLLWIGGALLLGRIGAAGPKIMMLLFGKTPLLRDVKRGLKGSGNTESVNRLAVIMLLTLSIVTLAAVQGYTGTLVDEKTATAQVGSDLQITMEESSNASSVESVIAEIYDGDITMVATTVPSLALKPQEGGDSYQTWVLLKSSDEVLRWSQQSLPGEDVDEALTAYQQYPSFSAGEDAAYSLGLWGSGRRGGSSDSGDLLLVNIDEDSSEASWDLDKSENITFTWEEIEFSIDGGDVPDDPEDFDIDALLQGLQEYSLLTEVNLSNADFSGQDLSQRDFGLADFSNSDLTNTNLSGTNLSEALLFNTSLAGANLAGANLSNVVFVDFTGFALQGTDLRGANLLGMFGAYNFQGSLLNASTICPDGTTGENGSCSFDANQPTPLASQLLASGISLNFNITEHNATLRYIGVHQFIPGISSTTMADSLIIGQDAWVSFVGVDAFRNHTANTWIVNFDNLEGETLQALRASLEADSRVSSAQDWETAHEAVERDGGLIFGTPGLLSLQFVVASLAAVASSFVFLSLVLNQRQKDLAILQAIGASPNQIIRLVLFEILSIVMVSMVLGVILGMGIALSFNGFFAIFGFIFQIFGGSSTIIDRELVWPWFELVIVALSVFIAVVFALLVTTRKALKSDLASVLKGE